MPTAFIPAPTGGENDRDHIFLRPDTDADLLHNVVPDNGFCRPRGGVTEHAELNLVVHTLMQLKLQDGTEKLVAISDVLIMDVTAGGSGSSITGADAPTQGIPWQYCVFQHALIICNGTDGAQFWTGTGNFAALTFTGATLTTLINVNSYKRRLYFVQKNTSTMWYGGTDVPGTSATPALTSFDFNSVFMMGGNLLFVGPTNNSNYSNQELFVAVSSEGEVLVYQGSYPGDSTWSLVARFFLGKALGYRCGFYVGTDLHIITAEGTVAMSELLAGVQTDSPYQVVSGKKRKAFIEAFANYGPSRIWMGIHFPKRGYVVLNYPAGGDLATGSKQFVMNTITKGWGSIDGWSAHSWAIYNNDLYFGDTNGFVYKADVDYKDDNPTNITWKLDHCFHDLGAPGYDKKITNVQPLFITQAAADEATPFTSDIKYYLDVDGESTAYGSTFHTFSVNNVASTETVVKQRFPLVKAGKFAKLRFGGEIGNNSNDHILKYIGSWVQYEIQKEAA